MKIRIVPALLSGLSLLFSTSVTAHIGHAEDGMAGNLVHLLTGGHHAPLLILAVVGIVYLVRKNQRSNR